METLTVEELSQYLKLYEYTIRRLARSGRIPSFSAIGGSASGRKAGGQWRIRKDEINKWPIPKREHK